MKGLLGLVTIRTGGMAGVMVPMYCVQESSMCPCHFQMPTESETEGPSDVPWKAQHLFWGSLLLTKLLGRNTGPVYF